MTQDEIIEMAKQAGFDFLNGWRDWGESCEYGEAWPEQIEAFAKLVAAKEREACAKLVEVSDDLADWEIICGSDGRVLLNEMAKVIRARGTEA